ncbi:hypothetical protein CYLTODRAFT_243591 [Cylindrobasidium torrendii FP15055 ss-10]|uniref:Uncharacterized protein n=1 Tax=Cylindrobasidium torrendii FP15055 ss-10 TaxID=1314674 RepID=A0A0D7BFN6_9AGAR|nr:hypothetical protein CYLTODRAFT_243591 [Cylindrobasidium torrendii FP15055 ss-10]
MPSSSASTATLYNEQMSFHHEPAATEASNGSPKSLASGLSSASSTSSSSTARAEARHKRRLAQSKYHDIDYLKTLANAGLTDGSVNVLSGKQIGEFVGLLSKDPTLRNRTGPVVVARSAVTGGRKIVDYARMWRGDTKAHRNKGPRKDFLEEEFDSARDAQSVIEEALYATVPEDEAVQHDEELKRTVKEFDKAFRRQSYAASSALTLPSSIYFQCYRHHAPEWIRRPPRRAQADDSAQEEIIPARLHVEFSFWIL